jgi:hypothetical protein
MRKASAKGKPKKTYKPTYATAAKIARHRDSPQMPPHDAASGAS